MFGEAELVGVAFSIKTGEGYYVPCTTDFEETKNLISRFREVFRK